MVANTGQECWQTIEHRFDGDGSSYAVSFAEISSIPIARMFNCQLLVQSPLKSDMPTLSSYDRNGSNTWCPHRIDVFSHVRLRIKFAI